MLFKQSDKSISDKVREIKVTQTDKSCQSSLSVSSKYGGGFLEASRQVVKEYYNPIEQLREEYNKLAKNETS